MSDYLILSRLTKIYPSPDAGHHRQGVRPLHQEGEFVCLIGHSGCGKSTVLSMIAGLNEITAGAIILAGKELSGPGPDRGMVFQSPCLLPWMTAFENVILGVNQVFYTAAREERRQIAEYYLCVVGLAMRCTKAAELSQGMRQRVRHRARPSRFPRRCCCLTSHSARWTRSRALNCNRSSLISGARSKTALMVTHDVDEALFLPTAS